MIKEKEERKKKKGEFPFSIFLFPLFSKL